MPHPGWFVYCRSKGFVVALCALGAAAQAQEDGRQVDPALVGQWVAESITDDRGIQRWSVERKADGSFTARHFIVGRGGAKERDVAGRWHTQGGVLHMVPALDSAEAGAWRYEAHQSDCWRMEAVDAASGTPLEPAMRFGECRALVRWPVPDQIRRTCVLDKPFVPTRTEVDFRIALEPDGKRYATADGKREPGPVEVRDYPVLRDFDPRTAGTITNAGEALLTLVQSAVERDGGFARTLGFRPRDVRGARVYVLAPPRPQRPMDYYSAGRNTMLEALDAEGKSMGMAMYAPFIIACPAGD